MRRFALLGLVLASCASAPRARVASAVERGDLDAALEAYERFREVEGADHDLLARMAALLLEREARSDDASVRRAAIAQLSLAGTAGMPVLVRLSEEEGLGETRLAALEALARRGREDARHVLRGLADERDPEVVAVSVLGMDPALDGELLLELTGSEHAGLRRAAVERLAAVASDAPVRERLAELARVDSEASVRAAAVRALGRAGPAAVDMLRERLADPDASVRFAAVGALIEADEERGRIALGAMLEVSPSPAGVEAARLLARRGAGPEGLAGAQAARAFLRRALASADASLRAQAGVAIASLPEGAEAPIDALREALAGEADPDVRLSLARALLRHDAPAARAVLSSLVAGGEGMARVQAASILAGDGDRAARAALEEAVGSGESSIVRRTAARALAREAMAPDAARRLLRDEDALVRIYAAGGILAAAVAG